MTNRPQHAWRRGRFGESHRAEPRLAASYVSMPPRHRLIWISPRTSMSASDLLTPAPFGRFLLHQVADRMTALYDEFTQAHLAVLDIPPAAESKYELRMLSITNGYYKLDRRSLSLFVRTCDESQIVPRGCIDGTDCEQRLSDSGRHVLVSLEMEFQVVTAPFTWEHRGGTTRFLVATCRLWI